MPAPAEFLSFVDDNADSFISRLAVAVSIPSYVQPLPLYQLTLSDFRVSGDAAHRKDVFAMSEWLNVQLKQLGVDTKLVDLGKHFLDGQELLLPPVILGRIGNDPNKTTVLIYGHFDVQPVRFACLLFSGFFDLINEL